jgi:polysaccharide biosynthesis transport protein
MSSQMRRRLTVVLAATLLGLLGAATVAATSPERFTAQTTLFVYAHPGDSPTGAASAEELAALRVKSYTSLVTGESVMREVARRLGMPDTPQQLAERTEVANPLDTVLITISVTDLSPERAARLADEIGEVFIARANQLENQRSFAAMQHVNVQMAEPAAVPLTASSLSLPVMLGLGLLAGLSIGLIITLAQERRSMPGGFDSPVHQTGPTVRRADHSRPSLEPMPAGQFGNIDATHGTRPVNGEERTERP